MATSKYDKYFIREPIEMGKFVPCLRYSSDFAGTEFSIRWHYITAPYLMEDKPHAHDFDQFTCFIGGNPMNIRDFGAEVEFFLGEEGTKHIIKATTIVYIPRGMVHGPLSFKKIDKPIMFVNVPLASKYVKKSRLSLRKGSGSGPGFTATLPFGSC